MSAPLRLLLAALVLTVALPASAADWPQFAGPTRDLHAPKGETLSAWDRAGPKVLWERDLGGGFSAVTAVGDTLYTMWSDDQGEHVGAFEAATGKTLWRYRVDERVFQDSQGGPGPRATPTVAGDDLVTMGAYGILVVLDRKTGALKWKKDLVTDFAGTLPKFGYSESPLVSDGKVFVVGGGPGQSLLAFSLADGSLEWKAGDYPAAYPSAIAVELHGEPVIVALTRTHLVGVRCGSGEVLWDLAWRGENIGFNGANPVRLSPDTFLVSTATGKGTALVRVSKRGDAWSTDIVWHQEKLMYAMSTGVLHGGYVYGFTRGKLTAVSAADGTQAWTTEGLGRGTALVAGGQLVVLSDECELMVGPVSPKAWNPAARHELWESRCWTLPTLAGGRVFVRDEKKMVALSAR